MKIKVFTLTRGGSNGVATVCIQCLVRVVNKGLDIMRAK